jgi:alpha-amylase/alpha-mannosidase (GH57 family)
MRYICVHGHFYQPPRENPSLEAIELQDSAYPYHDWNERITAECYSPNATSRILDTEQRITQMVNNYAHISFNFGPTLLSWIEPNAPKTYQALLEADKSSQEKYSGHGSALAQAYNHMILPLANTRDKITQVKWGNADFKHRFGRVSEGMWLPETAVNIETLEVLAANGVKFTVLAPRQANRIRKRGTRTWQDVSGERIDPSRAYLVNLPSRKTISVFFYDGHISQGVAFEHLLDNGQRFADRLISGFSDARDWPQLVNIATDGESYGHHHRFGEMALSYALHYIETNKLAELTNYGQFLERHAPDHSVEIVENSSWSCVHGIERWRTNCGCNSGGHAGWTQQWRQILRAALDWLRDQLIPLYESKAAPLLKDPWSARDYYIHVILDRSPENVGRFFACQATHPLSPEEQVAALKLLEIQRYAMLMYTSCGWFFDELSGLETVQVIQYAGRAVRLAQAFLGNGLEAEFEERLAAAKSNLPEHGDGKQIYEKWVKPAFVSTSQVAGHYAISSLFESYAESTRIYCYEVSRGDYSLEVEGKLRMAVGHARFGSTITQEAASLAFGVLHLGDHNISGGVRHFDGPETYKDLKRTLAETFSKADTPAMINAITQAFPESPFSLRTLFRDKQRRIVDSILNESLASASAAYQEIFDNQAPLIRFLNNLGIPVPAAFQSAAEIALNSELKRAFERPEFDIDGIQGSFKEAAATRVKLDVSGLEYALRTRMEKEADAFALQPADLDHTQRFRKLLEFAATLPFPVNLWEVQNLCYRPLIQAMDELRPQAGEDDVVAQSTLNELAMIREKLRIHV